MKVKLSTAECFNLAASKRATTGIFKMVQVHERVYTSYSGSESSVDGTAVSEFGKSEWESESLNGKLSKFNRIHSKKLVDVENRFDGQDKPNYLLRIVDIADHTFSAYLLSSIDSSIGELEMFSRKTAG